VEPPEISVNQLALEPEWFATSLDASHDMHKPRRRPVGSMTDKAPNAVAKASGKRAPATSPGMSQKRKHDAIQESVAQGASHNTPASLNPLHPQLPTSH
jgi:hypothetical protein